MLKTHSVLGGWTPLKATELEMEETSDRAIFRHLKIQTNSYRILFNWKDFWKEMVTWNLQVDKCQV